MSNQKVKRVLSHATASMEKYPVKPGDLLWYAPTPSIELYGIVLERFESIRGLDGPPLFEPGLPDAPGVSIYWMTSNIKAHWDYAKIQAGIFCETWKIITAPEYNAHV